MKKAIIFIWMIAMVLVGIASGLCLKSNNGEYLRGIQRAERCIYSGGVIMVLPDGDACIYD